MSRLWVSRLQSLVQPRKLLQMYKANPDWSWTQSWRLRHFYELHKDTGYATRPVANLFCQREKATAGFHTSHSLSKNEVCSQPSASEHIHFTWGSASALTILRIKRKWNKSRDREMIVSLFCFETDKDKNDLLLFITLRWFFTIVLSRWKRVKWLVIHTSTSWTNRRVL